MSYVIDGDLSQAIQLPDELTGAVFGPDITRAYVGIETALKAKITELELDRRGVSYQLTRQGDSPLWQLVLQLTQNIAGDDPSDPDWETNFELPINIVWRLTHEFAEIDYRKIGRYDEVLHTALDSTRRREFNKLLEELLSGQVTGPENPDWIPLLPADVQTALLELITRFERGKATGPLGTPVLSRDASFRKEANYRASITGINSLYTSAALKVKYPEIPSQFQAEMPTNGMWKLTRNDWEVDSTGQGTESNVFTWWEWHDPIDYVKMTV